MKSNNDTGLRLKELREMLGFTQKELSAKIGFNSTYYSQIERGEKGITSKLTNILFVHFGVSSDWLLNGIGDKPSIVFVANSGDKVVATEKVAENQVVNNEVDKNELAFQFFELIHKILIPKKQIIVDSRKLLFMLTQSKSLWVNENGFEDAVFVNLLKNLRNSETDELNYNNLTEITEDINRLVKFYDEEAYSLLRDICNSIFRSEVQSEEDLLQELKNKAEKLEVATSKKSV